MKPSRDRFGRRPVGSSTARAWRFGILIAALAALAYWPALRGEFIWDDDAYVSDNKTVTTSAGFAKIWSDYTATPQYYPLVFTSYWIEYRLWGDNTLGYHLTNLVLHVCSAVVLGRVLTYLRLPGAWLAAVVFAVHPVNVETVAWITERKNALSGLFYVLAFSAYARFARLGEDESLNDRADGESPNVWGQYFWALLLFVCALLSKTVTATLPAVLFVIIWWRRGRWNRRDLITLAPMFVIGAGLGLMTVWLEKHHVGAKGQEWSLSMLDRCLIAGRAPWFYASKIVLPWNLSFIYPRWQINTKEAWQFVFPIATVSTLAVLWLSRKRLGRGALVTALCFLGTLFPALGFFDVYPFRYSFVADHFQYIAGAFLIAGLAYAATRATERFRRSARLAIASLFVLVLVVVSRAQAKNYEDMYALWTSTIASNPGAWMAHGNLGDYFSMHDRYSEAEASYQRGLALNGLDSNKIRYNLGLALERLGRVDEAIESYRKAIEVDPDYAEAHVNLGVIYSGKGRQSEAERELREAVRVKPELAEAHYNLGNLLVSMRRVPEGRKEIREAIRLKPDYWDALVNEAGLAWTQGNINEAVSIYRQVLQRNPGNQEALVNLGSALVEQRRFDEGIEMLRRGVQNRPQEIEPALRLAQALSIAGRIEEARSLIESLKRRAPDDPRVRELASKLLASPAP